MRILILSLPRTGSTSFLYKCAEENILKPIFEPLDPLRPEKLDITQNNIAVKTMIYHIPPGFNDAITGYVALAKEFDKVILLSRKDLNECAESWAYLRHHNNKNFDSTKHYVWTTPPDVDKHMQDVIKWDSDLKEISDILNVDIIYYEDIFDKNSHERYRKNVTLNKNKLI